MKGMGLVVLGAALGAGPFAYADTLHVVADTSIRENAPDQEGGRQPSVTVSRAGSDIHGYVRFDLSPLAGLPLQARIHRALLGIWAAAGADPGTVEVHPVLGPWDEATLTWATAPDLTAPVAQYRVPGGGDLHYVTADVTSVVQGWLDGTMPNEGLALRPGTAGMRVEIGSKERGSTGHPMELEVVLQGPSDAAAGTPRSEGAVDAPMGPAAWTVLGNAGTTPGTNFLGTTDNQPLELWVNGVRALRLEPNAGSPNIIGGFAGNAVAPGAAGAVIGGGGSAYPHANGVNGSFGTVAGGYANQAAGTASVGGGNGNRAGAQWSVVGGGENNQASGQHAVVAGGQGNGATADRAVVSGGKYNLASGVSSIVTGGISNWADGTQATVGGGNLNRAYGGSATVGGGVNNVASGIQSTIPGGAGNRAGGWGSFAAGLNAVVRDPAASGDTYGDEGTFAWADASTQSTFTSTGPNQFLVRATGGVAINTNTPAAGSSLTVSGDSTMTGNLRFGASTRQMLNLWEDRYGIGVQGLTTYFRTDAGFGGFAWFQGGTHSNGQNDPGGGMRQMRLDAWGNLFVAGMVSGGGADFAEMLPAHDGVAPGDVLAIGPDGRLGLSTEPYQDTLAGVYSTKPGLLGGAADGVDLTGKVPLAVSGVIPVKVTAENGAIAPGDSLTSSSIPGRAMKATKVRVGGVAFFPSGVILGKALESLDSGEGLIQALVVLQ
jgi:hypothetical protein